MMPGHRLVCFACNSELFSRAEAEEHRCPPGHWQRNLPTADEIADRGDPPIGDRLQTGFMMLNGIVTT
ncbi:hypothetical protein CMI37_29180 [Candidatus Pacearchaeota archaeon]|nr:hypothetical protein [Candidatus Pacearchaeota archaeon]